MHGYLASDPAQNPYWKRDVRRVYPQLSVVTQSELSGLLIEHSTTPRCVGFPCRNVSVKQYVYSIPAPGQVESDVPAASQASLDLTGAIASITLSQKVYTESKLPPALPTPYKRWNPERAPDAPHDPHVYFPMDLYR